MGTPEEDALEVAKIAAMISGQLKNVDQNSLSPVSHDKMGSARLNPEQVYHQQKQKLQQGQPQQAAQPPQTQSIPVPPEVESQLSAPAPIPPPVQQAVPVASPVVGVDNDLQTRVFEKLEKFLDLQIKKLTKELAKYVKD